MRAIPDSLSSCVWVVVFALARIATTGFPRPNIPAVLLQFVVLTLVAAECDPDQWIVATFQAPLADLVGYAHGVHGV